MKSIQQETENNETEKQNKNIKEKKPRRVEKQKRESSSLAARLDTNRFPPQIPNIPGSRLSVARKRAQQREKRRS